MDSSSKGKRLSETNTSLWDRTTTSLHKKDQSKSLYKQAEKGINNAIRTDILQLSQSIDSYESIA